MPLNTKRLSTAKTYVILDTQVLAYESLLALLPSLVKAGVGLVQLRDKVGKVQDQLDFYRRAKKITKDKTLLIANDRVDVALAAEVDGVHVGQEDLSLSQVRELVKYKMFVGVSCQSLAHARRAEAQGADYIGFGSVFKTKTKPERQSMDLKLLQKVHSCIKIPIFPIGGITRENVGQVVAHGAKRVAVCREVLESQTPAEVINDFDQLLSSK